MKIREQTREDVPPGAPLGEMRLYGIEPPLAI